ncbi:type II secretion system F family protein [Campylobacter sp. 19-13652]|uniref:type II secretion system F family protein n=1 Tax=Campylobacter sp. 19-13652 TaxID=2840180 RepID=UPI001C74401F|nr:type II secretion system F family protein [Campylobacter sp. 19-13652]BCX78550.1 hypothetical protein LBC_00120 [Campylobacter sp. 19-13652]
MVLFYVLVLFVGIGLLYYALRQDRRLKAAKEFCTASASGELFIKFNNTAQTEELLRRSDKSLSAITKLENNVLLKLLIALAIILPLLALKKAGLVGLSDSSFLLIAIFSFVGAIVLPSMIKRLIIERRIAEISKNIPMFVDLLAVCVQTGMNIESAIKFLESSISNINKAFAPFLSKMILKSQISGLEAALDELQRELPSTQISMMCVTLKQSLKYGSAVYDSLTGLSEEIRQMELLQTEEAIGKLGAKMSVPLILFFMFPVIIIIAAPGIMKVLGGI